LSVDAGDDFTSAFRLLTNYNDDSLVYQATELNDLLEKGKTYRFVSRSKNLVGYSQDSIYSYIAFGHVPDSPGSPERLFSTETSISLRWAAPAASDLSISGYILNMDDGRKADLHPVFIGSNRPDILEFQMGDLTTGLPYRFSAQAININGNSEESVITLYYACAPPRLFDTPYYIASDQSLMTIEIGWDIPKYQGGCPILGYRIFIIDELLQTT
jgi:hypothetical protein